MFDVGIFKKWLPKSGASKTGCCGEGTAESAAPKAKDSGGCCKIGEDHDHDHDDHDHTKPAAGGCCR